MEIDQYIKTFDDVFAKVGDKDIALFVLGQAAKDRRTIEINNKNGGNGGGSGNGHSNGSERATDSQISFLKKLGIEAKPNLSKAEASRLIDEAKGKK